MQELVRLSRRAGGIPEYAALHRLHAAAQYENARHLLSRVSDQIPSLQEHTRRPICGVATQVGINRPGSYGCVMLIKSLRWKRP